MMNAVMTQFSLTLKASQLAGICRMNSKKVAPKLMFNKSEIASQHQLEILNCVMYGKINRGTRTSNLIRY